MRSAGCADTWNVKRATSRLRTWRQGSGFSSTEFADRLVLATPLFVQSASAKPLGLLGRWRMRQELARLHGVRGGRWQPQLSPEDRARMYVPVTERGKGGIGGAN